MFYFAPIQICFILHPSESVLFCSHPNLFYVAPIRICAERTHQQQLEDDCKPARLPITSLPVQHPLHCFALHCITTSHYIASRASHLPTSSISDHPVAAGALFNPTDNTSLNANGNTGDSDCYAAFYGFEKGSTFVLSLFCEQKLLRTHRKLKASLHSLWRLQQIYGDDGDHTYKWCWCW